MVRVRFIKDTGQYRIGNTATLSRGVANVLIERGLAVLDSRVESAAFGSAPEQSRIQIVNRERGKPDVR